MIIDRLLAFLFERLLLIALLTAGVKIGFARLHGGARFAALLLAGIVGLHWLFSGPWDLAGLLMKIIVIAIFAGIAASGRPGRAK